MKPFIAACITFFLLSCGSVTKIYLVRHAEKASSSTNPDLKDPEGFARANTLKDSMMGVHLNGVYSTNFLRTVHTAGPTAAAQNQTVKTYTDGDKLMDSLSQGKNKKYLVVGHSNTIPGMIRHFGLDPGFSGDIPDNDFDNLFIVIIKRRGHSFEKTIQIKTYGAASP